MIRLLTAVSVLLGGVSPALAGEPTERHLAALRADFGAPVAVALDAIDGTGRRLLAARSYLRSEARLVERWSWTEAQIAAYQGSPAQRRRDAAIVRVRCEFEAANPGYTLFVNPAIRSLEVQVAHWNRNASVADSAAALFAAVRTAVAAQTFPRPGTAAGTAAFRRLLVRYDPRPKPSLAAPGLSLHGQMQAVDFQVKSASRIVAGAEVAAIVADWETAGWTAKLQAAVAAAGAGFTGPLQDPYEPWHYDFRPTRANRAPVQSPDPFGRCAAGPIVFSFSPGPGVRR